MNEDKWWANRYKEDCNFLIARLESMLDALDEGADIEWYRNHFRAILPAFKSR